MANAKKGFNLHGELGQMIEIESLRDTLKVLQNTIEHLDIANQKEFKNLDRRLEKIDLRMWQIILLLLSYPLGLIVGKLCHVF